MGREFELKFAATAENLAALKARYPHLRPICMQTTYYDTARADFGQRRWTLRRRLENDVSVCTLKTPLDGPGRAEWEVPCADIAAALPKLCALGAPEELLVLARDGLTESCGARFTRLCGLLEVPGCTVELALDEGVLLGGGTALPFREVEVELKAGSEDACCAFAAQLASALGLQPEPRSKIARAQALARNCLEREHGI